MSVLGIALGAGLLAIAALHAFWAFGGVWPAADGATLVRAVVGDPRLKRMPGRGPTLLVVLALILAALVALAPSAAPAIDAADALVALVFLGRGAAGYVPAWRRAHPLQPFARLDVIAYSPLCLAIGAGFAFRALSGFAA